MNHDDVTPVDTPIDTPVGTPIDPDLAPTDPAEPSVGRPRPARQPRPSRAEPAVLAAISLGGMLGASARYGVAKAIPASSGTFPWATLWTNLSGSFLLGLLLLVILRRLPSSRLLRPFLATGVIGAYTTMSTFEVETALLAKDGHAPIAALYALVSLSAGLVLAYVGIVTGRLVPVSRPQSAR